LIADNGSTDGSVEIALKEGARVVKVENKGYGSALISGIESSLGKYIIMGDADDSYDFTSLMPFMEKLREGYDLVMGNRFRGGIEKGAMPPLHKYLGNPVLSGIGRLFFRSNVRDFHCGLRGFTKKSVLSIGLNTTGMEFATEMIVKAIMNHLKITEVPVTLHKDGRSRPPHLRSWRDGWRHLKFLLMYSPRWLFFYPGLFLTVLGGLGTILLSFKAVRIGNISFDINTMLFCVLMVILGVQTISFSIITSAYARIIKLYPVNDKFMESFYSFSVLKGAVTGVIIFLIGIFLSAAGISVWAGAGFGSLMPASLLRLLFPAVLALSIGWQIIFTSFLLGIFQIRTKYIN
jgi:glycosyltransferase involved in cell wall biosynthesis